MIVLLCRARESHRLSQVKRDYSNWVKPALQTKGLLKTKMLTLLEIQ